MKSERLKIHIFVLVCCLAYLIVRFAILYTSLDHLHNVDLAEFRIVDQARAFLKGEGAVEVYTHLWGTPISAVLIIPFMLLPLDDGIILKLFILTLAVIGFAALLHMIAREKNLYAALLVALLMIFPPVGHLKWAMMTWGGYPEAYGLMPVLLLWWALTLQRTTTARLIILGVGSAFLVIYSPACVYIVGTIALLTLWHFVSKKDWHSLLWFALGATLLLGPFLLSFFVGSNDQDQYKVFGDTSFRVSDYVTLPRWTNLKYVICNMEVERIFIVGFERLVLIAAIVWVFFTSIDRNNKTFRRLMIFPLIMILGLFIVSFFERSYWINTRHVLGLVTVGYVCIGLAAADQFVSLKNTKIGWLDRGIRLTVVVVLLILNLSTIIPLFQPEDAGMLWRFRGGKYSNIAIGSVFGSEVDRLNCLLDQREDLEMELDLQYGFGTVFSQNGYYNCCRYEPIEVDYPSIESKQGEQPSKEFYFSVGCAMAIKANVSKADLTRFDTAKHPQAQSWMQAGYDACAASPCATMGEERPRPVWLQRVENSFAAVRKNVCRWSWYVQTDEANCQEIREIIW